MLDRKPAFIRLVRFRREGYYILRGWWEGERIEDCYLRDSLKRFPTKVAAMIARDMALGGIPCEWGEKDR
jgi:hypothetical protein